MTVTAIEIGAMRHAIAISALGLGSTSPNPPVGCIILDRDGHVAGMGYHRRKGEAHAEANALAAAGARAAGGTAAVTLEPCNHHGRTPPCHQALIDAGIKRVLIALIDPTSRGVGGVARLRDASVDVEVGVLADEALVVLGPWLEALESGRPRVRWVYEAGPEGPRAVPDDLLTSTGLRFSVDSLLRADGRVEEGIPGAHGEAVFAPPDTLSPADAETALTSLYSRGVRSLLLHGGLELAEPFLRQQLVDGVSVLVPATGSSAPMRTAHDLLPPAFRILSVTSLRTGVVLHGTPN
jgi:diaminohydroxyphosphoribosylaminopyrimidine deaminase/5-amino-6-(5-phosphoribosylamino)uracil reductase